MNLPNGTIFRFTNPEARNKKFAEGKWDQLCVALFDGEFSNPLNGCYRRLACDHSHTGEVNSLPLKSIEIVGLMPKSSQGATKWDDSFAFPHDMRPGTVFQFGTKPDWWNSSCDWTTRMVVMFPKKGESTVRFRRMPKAIPYVSNWDPRKDEFEVVGHLTPDQLHTTDSTVGFRPPNVTEEETVNETVTEEKTIYELDPRFVEGTVFRLTGDSKPSWWVVNTDKWNDYCVVIELSRSHHGAVPFRLLTSRGIFDTHCFFPDVDAFEIIGRMLDDKPDSIKLDDVIRLAQPQQLELTLALGTTFRFNKIPERWEASNSGKVGEVFIVIEDSRFAGVGQCISQTEGLYKDCWWHESDGVLPTDDISIVVDEVEVDEPAQLPLGTKLRFNKFPDRWNYLQGNASTVFEVVDPPSGFGFTGVGQCIKMVDHAAMWYSARDGVLSTDNIVLIDGDKITSTWSGWEIEHSSGGWSARREDGTYVCGKDLSVVIEAITTRLKRHQKQEVERLTMKIQELEKKKDSWLTADDLHARITSLSKENGELRGVNGELTAVCDLEKRIEELEKENGLLKGSMSDWMASYYEAHRTIKKLGEKKPNGVLAFIKKIW